MYPGKICSACQHACTTEAQKIATSCRKTPQQWIWWLTVLHSLRNMLLQRHSWPLLHYTQSAPSPANIPNPGEWDPPEKNTVQRMWPKSLHLLVQCISISHHPGTGLVLQMQRRTSVITVNGSQFLQSDSQLNGTLHGSSAGVQLTSLDTTWDA